MPSTWIASCFRKDRKSRKKHSREQLSHLKKWNRRRRQAPQMTLERLEDRLAPAVTSSLTNGVLDIALTAAGDNAQVSHPTGSIQILDPVKNQVVASFRDGSVT